MSRTVTLAQVGPKTAETRYHVMLDGYRVGVATEVAHDPITPWRLTLPGTCANLRRSSRMVLEQTVERLLTDRPARSVVYVPSIPGSQWCVIAEELRAAGFEVREAPMPEAPHAVVPVLVCTREV
jgi:hypothetical protein